VCHSTKHIRPMNMYAATGADLIFYKPLANGTLYVLKFKKDNEKQHSTVNNCIMRLDDTLKLNGGRDITYFLSINDDDALPGSKVLSFDREGRKADPLYRQLFDGRDSLLPGVSVWNNDIEETAELSGDDVDGFQSESSENEEDVAGNSNISSYRGKQRASGGRNEPSYMENNEASNAGACSVLQAEKVERHLTLKYCLNLHLKYFILTFFRMPWYWLSKSSTD
jgi:hypothetical protein